jgi:pyruvate formate lyase activating enzyme
LCDGCYWVCPAKAIYMEGNRMKIDQEKCIHCGKCYDNCPNEAISIYESDQKSTV